MANVDITPSDQLNKINGNQEGKLEKTRLWLGFGKFVLGTVVLGAFSTYLAHRIQQQELDIKAQKQTHELRTAEQQYLERIADRVQSGGTPNRRVLAQMMSHVSQTQPARERWQEYLKAIERDLEAEKTAAREKDSLLVQVGEQQKALTELKAKLEDTRKKATDEAEAEAAILKQQIATSRSELKKAELELAEAKLELNRRRNEFAADSAFDDATIAVTVDQLFKGADLTGRRLSEIYKGSLDLQGITLTGADVSDVGLMEGNFVNANFDGARLSEVHFERANMYGASFRQALLYNVDFTQANLRDADFSEARIGGDDLGSWKMTFRLADLRGVKGLTCDMLSNSKDWELATRDASLECGKPSPVETSDRNVVDQTAPPD